MRVDELQSVVEAVRSEHAVPGIAAGVVVRGEITAVGCGLRDNVRGLPMTAHSQCYLASISKPLTALLTGLLVRAGLFGWDQPLCERLPDLRFSDPLAQRWATPRDLVLHRTGLPDGSWPWYHRRGLDLPGLFRLLPHFRHNRPLRDRWQYQNLNLTVLGALIHRVTGREWHQEIIERLLKPLGADCTTTIDGMTARGDHALPHGPNGFGPCAPMPFCDLRAMAPAGAVNGSITDLLRIARALLPSGRGDARGALPDAVLAESTVVQHGSGAQPWPEINACAGGLGWQMMQYRGRTCWAASGGVDGFVSRLVLLPEDDIAAAVLVNREAALANDVLGWELVDRALGIATPPWRERLLAQKRGYREKAYARIAARAARPSGAPAQPATELAGSYHHDAYGSCALEARDGALALRFRHLDLPLTPLGGDAWAAVEVPDVSEYAWDIACTGNGVTLPLEGDAPPVLFTRA